MIHWESFSAFLAMGGYGLYVWGSVLMCFALLGGELLSLLARRRVAMLGIRRSGDAAGRPGDRREAAP